MTYLLTDLVKQYEQCAFNLKSICFFVIKPVSLMIFLIDNTLICYSDILLWLQRLLLGCLLL